MANLIQDELETETSREQAETVRLCQKMLATGTQTQTLPPLQREKHIAFLKDALGTLPSGFVAVDASRPWILYWSLTALYLLGEDITPYHERGMVQVMTDVKDPISVVSTLAPMQNPHGGFGGGHGQMSHCAASYASVLSLLMVGGDAALGLIDRQSLWQWLGQLKQPDGGFTLCVGGEEDVRGAYCAMVMIALLRLPLELPAASPAKTQDGDTFLKDLPEYLSRCQTYEGGISGAPGTEAHAAYAYCALACLCILGHPREMLNRYLDVPRLISWLAARQFAPEGGFAGRTNKLVDGCYSHWVGGCWPLVEAAVAMDPSSDADRAPTPTDFYDREALIRYILGCCQDHRGGLRDKPGKRPDAYHSCYVLAGLSSAQHRSRYGPHRDQEAAPLSAAFGWRASGAGGPPASTVGPSAPVGTDDRVALIHPVFVLPWGVAERTRAHFEPTIESVPTSTNPAREPQDRPPTSASSS